MLGINIYITKHIKLCVISCNANFTNTPASNRLCFYFGKNFVVCWAVKNQSSVLIIFQICVIKQIVRCLLLAQPAFQSHSFSLSHFLKAISLHLNFEKRSHRSLWITDLFEILSALRYLSYSLIYWAFSNHASISLFRFAFCSSYLQSYFLNA